MYVGCSEKGCMVIILNHKKIAWLTGVKFIIKDICTIHTCTYVTGNWLN